MTTGAPGARAEGAGGREAPTRSRIRRVGLWLAVAAISGLALPNVGILGLHKMAEDDAPSSSARLPIKNFTEVDQRVWRGAAPGKDAYPALAANGVTTLIDLRAEEGIATHEPALRRLGITRVHLPLRDGQSPRPDQVDRFLEAVEQSPGRVYVHCGAGVGRTGTMAAAYLVRTGQASGDEAVRKNLAVGTPSIEQLAFSAGLEGPEVRRPRTHLVALSRAVDAPRRLWVRIRKSYR